MGIPALIGIEVSEDYDGELAIVDGYEGKLIVAPNEEILELYRKMRIKRNCSSS